MKIYKTGLIELSHLKINVSENNFISQQIVTSVKDVHNFFKDIILGLFHILLSIGARKYLFCRTPQAMYSLYSNRVSRLHKLSIVEPGLVLDGGPLLMSIAGPAKYLDETGSKTAFYHVRFMISIRIVLLLYDLCLIKLVIH